MRDGETTSSTAATIPRHRRLRRAWVACGATSAMLAFASLCHADPAPEVRAEIEFLLSSTASSGCEFFRNGTWYDAKAAAAHLRLKYDALLQRGLVHDSADFIERAASQSSLSGRPYAIRCGGEPPVATRQWFIRRLALFRQKLPP